MTIRELVQKYESDRVNYRLPQYNETLLRSDFLDPLFELLGWDIKNNQSKSTNEREVILEEGLRADISENAKKPDYTFRLFSERKFFLEAKKPSVPIEANADTAKQIRRYGFTAKLKISVISNFEHLLIYDCSVPVESGDNHHKALIATYHYLEYETKFDELLQLLGRESVYSGSFDNEWSDIEDRINHFSVDDLFLQQINTWRMLLGQELFQASPGLSEQLLNDYVQSYINRIIFLRVCEDRNLETYQTLLQFANSKDFSALLKKFNDADKKYNSGLFDQFLSEKIIGDVSSAFWIIITQLYYPESPYSFAVFSSDILGRIYEIFLSEKLTINNGTLELAKKPEHVDRDIITTPTFIIHDILNQTVSLFLQDKTEEQILTARIADIACGSGAFLLEVFQLLNDTLIDYYLKHDASKLIQTGVNSYKLSFDTKTQLLLNCVFGCDKDFNAVEAAKFGLLLKLLENENSSSIASKSPILPSLSSNIHFGNSLISPSDIPSDLNSAAINPFDFGQTKYDVIVGNPPYMKSEDMVQITPLEFPIYKTKFTSAYKQFDKYFLFIEQGIRLLNDDGYLGYIVPSKFSKLGAAQNLREHLQNNKYLKTIVSFGANQIFKSKTTYTCLLVLQKRSTDEFDFSEIRKLSEWKVRDDAAIKYQKIRTDLLSSEAWVLVPPELINAFNHINNKSLSLENIVGSEGIFNGIQTSANNIYIFQQTKEDKNYYYFNKAGSEWKIEKEFTKPYYKTSAGQDNLNTYRPFKPNARVIYPYKVLDGHVELISLTDVQTHYPFAYKYLLANQASLNNSKRDIKPPPTNPNEWHRYGRSHALDKCSLPKKIVVGVLSQGNKYAVDLHGTLISSGGTAGYCVVAPPDNSDYSIYYIQAILNSKYTEWYSALNGEVFRGGYIARGTKVLKRLPIVKIDFTDKESKKLHDEIANIQEQLIVKQGEIDSNASNSRQLVILTREFNQLKSQLNDLLKTLYGLGDDDRLIPLIKEMYEAN